MARAYRAAGRRPPARGPAAGAHRKDGDHVTFGRPEQIGTHGAVSSTPSLATAAGMAVLYQGGNAFDAVAAVGFVLQVVEPHSNGLGGDVSIVAYQAATGKTTVIC